MVSQAEPVFIRMTVRNLDNNEIFFSNQDENEDPIAVVPGEGHIFQKVDDLLSSMNIGDSQSVSLSVEEGFGPVVEEAIQIVPLENLPEELRSVGTPLSVQTDQGQTVYGTVIKIEAQEAVVDFNHPLAGKSLQVEFEVVALPA